jgi:hypothetical protein
MYSFCAMNSLRMSFWMVPPSFSEPEPRFWAFARYMAQTALAAELIVMEVVASSRSMPAKRTSMSASEATATPPLPTSPRLMGGRSRSP